MRTLGLRLLFGMTLIVGANAAIPPIPSCGPCDDPPPAPKPKGNLHLSVAHFSK